VIAGEEWGASMQEMTVPPARQGSVEEYLHNKNEGDGYLLFNDETDKRFENRLPHRAIGVVYNPENERYGNYVSSLMPQRYDAFIFIDETKALHPMHIKPDGHKMPETYPFGL
jgi:erythromycin esterase-like protein